MRQNKQKLTERKLKAKWRALVVFANILTSKRKENQYNYKNSRENTQKVVRIHKSFF